MQLVKIKLERLVELAAWLSAQAGVETEEVSVIMMDDGEIELKVTNQHEIEYGLKIIGDQITFHTKSHVLL